MSDEAEQIIRDWIDSKCDPSPYSLEESFRRAMSVVTEFVNRIAAAFQIDWPDTTQEKK